VSPATPWARGRLSDPVGAPATGEVTDAIARVGGLGGHDGRGGLGGNGGVVVEEIRSGALAAPVDYCADVDEWVVVLAGAATMVVAGETLELVAGDWVLLPADTPHTLVRTDAGTHWLTVTAHGD
jgi:cupin 2 domain-containing protein